MVRTVDLISLQLADPIDPVIPSEDAHASEYIAACDARREFICGFTGSAGCAVVTLDKAALATDGRYFNQAAKQLDENWLLLKQGLQDVPTWQDWSADQANGGKTVAVDPELLAGSAAKKLASKIKRSGGADLLPLQQNLVDLVWGNERSPRPTNPVSVHPQKYAGKDVKTKLQELRQDLEKKNSHAMVVSMLDEVAWLLNLRGSDIPYNPVFFSYALVTRETATLFVDQSKLSKDSATHLEANGVSIQPYNAVYAAAEGLRASLAAQAGSDAARKKILISNKTSWALKQALGGEDAVEEIRSPIGDSKAVKTEAEMAGMRACHIRDGAALIQYFAWLEDQLVARRSVLDEVEAADKLDEFRSKQDHYVGLSFDTISSTGAKYAVDDVPGALL